MTPTVYAIHTGMVLVEPLKPLFAELLPHGRLVNIVDDSLLADVRAAGELTPAVTRRLVGYGLLAASAGASAILNCCSSVGEAAGILASLVEIPVVRIDERMAEEAVRLGRKIAVVATLPTTLHPTQKLVQRKAAAAGKEVVTQPFLADGAFDSLMRGDSAGHDRQLLEVISDAAAANDVVVLAQGSMARLLPLLSSEVRTPVLASPRLALEALRDRLS